MVSESWRHGKKSYPISKEPEKTYPVHKSIEFKISYSLVCQSGNKMFIEMILRKLESNLKMTLNYGDARLKFMSLKRAIRKFKSEVDNE